MICQPTRVFHLTSIHLKWVYDRRKLLYLICAFFFACRSFTFFEDAAVLLSTYSVLGCFWKFFFFSFVASNDCLYLLFFLNDTMYHIWWNCQILYNLLFCCSLHTHSFPTYFFFTSDHVTNKFNVCFTFSNHLDHCFFMAFVPGIKHKINT